MPRESRLNSRRRIEIFFALILAGMLYYQLVDEDHEVVINRSSELVYASEGTPVDRFEELIRKEPLAALLEARAQHVENVKDYRCTLVKQELLPSGMSAEQEIEVLHRLEPYSVVMLWKRNPGLAKRVLYTKGKLIDPDETAHGERELALCQPESAAAKWLIKSIKMPIGGSMAKKTARRSIDEFGFKRTLDLLIKYCEMARDRGEMSLEFRGETRFDGRPVWVLLRRLAYTGEKGIYPDRTAEIYVDKEYHIAIAVYCYSDDAKLPQNLLGKYEYRDITFDLGLTEADFAPATYGM